MIKKDIQREMISVIIPVYNRAAVLNRAVDSILRQSYRNLELLLIDDGSEDDSWLVCREYAGKDTRVRAIRQEHGGVSCARNTGLMEARGEFIYFLDSDDVASPIILERLHDDLIQHSAEYVCCKFRQSETPCEDFTELCDELIETDWKQALTHLYFVKGFDITIGTKLFRRSLIMEPEPVFFKEGCNFGEDCMWLSELLIRCNRALIDPSCLMLYVRDCDNSLCKQVNDLTMYIHYRWKRDFLKLHDFPTELIQWSERIMDSYLMRLLLCSGGSKR